MNSTANLRTYAVKYTEGGKVYTYAVGLSAIGAYVKAKIMNDKMGGNRFWVVEETAK